MSEVIIFDRIQLRRGTLADLVAVNEVLREGEACVELGTGKFKIGDGVTAWNSLAYQGIWTLADIRRALDLLGSTATGDIIYKGASGWMRLAKGADDEILRLVSGVPAWTAESSGGSGGYLDPRLNLVDPIYDFLGKPPTITTAEQGASYPWVANTIDTGGSIAAVNGGASAPGVWRLSIGNGTGHTILNLGDLANFTIGAGEVKLPFRFRVPTLPNGTDRFTMLVGWRDTWTGATQHGLYVTYVDNLNSGRLQMTAIVGGVPTGANGTTAVVANTWVSGYILVNAAGTQADLYVNGAASPEATISSGMPTGAMRIGGANYRGAGTAVRSVDFDYIGPPQVTFTTAR